ncbi:LacI family DNA-binding transcriptional regulator [Microbacterium halotolerans]|uniref:LacI family DNA-binding transcriptional regulator n=1 Tax=Microbacterium halotolerans TaxID=246613 RepID=UPI000E6AA0A2|nr:LacI family DNA-binding transcriptional regulator [Microbacterium halotolerans]
MDTSAAAPARATLAQVAERAGVSLKTASRALSGETYVAEATRARVVSAAVELGYQRNAAASLLASGRLADSIGLVTGDFTNPFYSAIAQAFEDEIRPHGIHLSVANSGESVEREQLLAADLADRQSKALVLVSAMPEHSGYAPLVGRGIPVVFVDRPPVGIEADSVIFDNRTGGRLAAEHLREQGHTRIAFVGDYSWLPTFRGRLDGMGDVLDGDASTWRGLLRTDAHDVDSARARTAELLALDEPPTALVAGNNRILLGMTEQLAMIDHGSRPAVVAFDDVEWARVLGTTVVTGDVEELGRRAARLATGRLADRARPAENVELPMRLIARASSNRGPR